MNKNTDPRWLEWAKELQFIAQAGLTYSRDPFDIERFERIREISAEIMSHQSDLPIEKVKELFCNETGFQTPKLDTRAAIFKNGKILLVKEKAGVWSMPGGWVDVNQSIKTNTEKEVKEEAGIDITNIEYLGSDYVKDKEILMITFMAEYVSGEIQKSCEVEGMGWTKLSKALEEMKEDVIGTKVVKKALDKISKK